MLIGIEFAYVYSWGYECACVMSVLVVLYNLKKKVHMHTIKNWMEKK